MPELGRDRGVSALDTPGYGESAPPPEPQTIEALTNALSVALGNLGYGDGDVIDIVGVHTGSLIAAEMALQRPDLVRRVVLSGIPLFEGEDRERCARHAPGGRRAHSELRQSKGQKRQQRSRDGCDEEVHESEPRLRRPAGARAGPQRGHHPAEAGECGRNLAKSYQNVLGLNDLLPQS